MEVYDTTCDMPAATDPQNKYGTARGSDVQTLSTHTHTHAFLTISNTLPQIRRISVQWWTDGWSVEKSPVARLELNLFPLHFPPCFLSAFLSLFFPPFLLLISISCARLGERGLFSLTQSTKKVAEALVLFHNLSRSLSLSLKQSTHAHLIAIHFSPPIRLSLPIHPSISLYKSCLFSLSVSWGRKQGFWEEGKILKRVKAKERGKWESVQEKMEGEEGKQPEEWGNGRDG